jgi:hypothetical protein
MAPSATTITLKTPAMTAKRIPTRHLVDSPLEGERHATAYRSCRLHQVNGVPIAP